MLAAATSGCPARFTVRRRPPQCSSTSVVRRRVRCCRPFYVHATTTCYLYPTLHIYDFSSTTVTSQGMSLPWTQFMYCFLVLKSYFQRSLRNATLRKIQRQPQVTFSHRPIYCFARNELTYIAAEHFLKHCSTQITKEIIESYHAYGSWTRDERNRAISGKK